MTDDPEETRASIHILNETILDRWRAHRQNSMNDTESDGMPKYGESYRLGHSHVLTPLRALHAVAPSDGETWMHKYSELDDELSFGCGLLEGREYVTFWKAKNIAAHGGIEKWRAAVALLRKNGWMVTQDE